MNNEQQTSNNEKRSPDNEQKMEPKLEVWKLAHQLTLEVYRVSKNFPSSEMYGLTSQIRRSSSSVPTNYNRRTRKTI